MVEPAKSSVSVVRAPEAEHYIGEWMERGRAWLDELQTPIGLRASSAAGRFHALFGRDTLWSVLLALEAARLRPTDADLARWAADFAAKGLQALAATQGTQQCDENEEQPGKIVHEYWLDIPARFSASWPLRAGRYYGAADGTYLYLLALATVWRQVAGGCELVASLWDHALAALHWALDDGDVDGDGLVEAQPRQPQGRGLRHQVWKDSHDALLLPDGRPPEPPVAWVELQGYAAAAFRAMIPVLQARGEDAALQRELARRIERLEAGLQRFWLPDEGCPAMALTRDKAPVPLVSSNIGHLLWCGALDDAHAEATANRLLQPDLLTSWGLRTLSARAYAFDPLSYHRGSVWPFDNAISAVALWRMGRRDDARALGWRVLHGIARFGTPVELYCVLPPAWVQAPDMAGVEALITYTRACVVQAWSAAALLVLAAQLLAE